MEKGKRGKEPRNLWNQKSWVWILVLAHSTLVIPLILGKIQIIWIPVAHVSTWAQSQSLIIVSNELAQMCSFGTNSLWPHGLYVARQAPLSMGFSQQEYWSVMPFPPPGDLPDPGIEPASLTSPALAGGLFTTSATWDALNEPTWSNSSLSELPLQVSKSFSSYQLCFGVFCGLSGITSALPHHRTWLTCPWPDTPLPISSLYPSHPAV